MQSFRYEELSRRYALLHGVLRALLAGYSGIEASEIAFRYGDRGKPRLIHPTYLHFNISDSGDLGLYAFACDCEIGVDLEEIQPISGGLESVARCFFSPLETAELLSLPEGERLSAFYRCWTRKEAYVKAVGDGLAIPLDTFQVSLLPKVPAAFVQFPEQSTTSASWELHHLDPDKGYVGAIAYAGAPRLLEIRKGLLAEDVIGWLIGDHT